MFYVGSRHVYKYILDRGLEVSQDIRGASKTDGGGHKKYSKMKCVIHLQCQKAGWWLLRSFVALSALLFVRGRPPPSSRSGRGPAGANLELGTQTQRLSSDLSIVISISWLSGYLGHKSHNTQQTNNSHKVIFSQAGHVPPLLDSFEIELWALHPLSWI